MGFLKLVFQYAIEWDIVENNPVAGIKRYATKARTRYITDDELDRILTAASPELKRVVMMCYLTGQRISDVLNIKQSDITNEGIEFTQEKTGQRVLVAFNDDLVSLVEVCQKDNHNDYLIPNPRTKKPYIYTWAHKAWSALMTKLAIENCNIHDLRAKAITDAKKQGKNAQALGGHATESMTNRYIRSRDIIVAQAPSIRQKK
jgi:integrase